MSFISTLRRLESEKLIHPPRWLIDNLCYATIMGSMSYGVSNDASDMDVYGFCMPPRDMIFPHLGGEIPGFGRQIQRFQQFQQDHIADESAKREYDLSIYSIVKYFQLCMNNNPNMIDSLFTPRRCVLHATAVSELTVENRRLFLHKGAIHKLRSYAYRQLSKIENQRNSSNMKRQADIALHGFDTKFGYHLARLVLQAEQILAEGDLDLERNREVLKSIRRGEWELARLKEWFEVKEKTLEEVFAKSTLREGPDECAIRTLLLRCLEHHYGNLGKIIAVSNRSDQLWLELQQLVEKYRL